MKASIAVSYVQELNEGPWIYRQALDVCLGKAAAAGFRAVHLLASSCDEILKAELSELFDEHLLKRSCVETDAGNTL